MSWDARAGSPGGGWKPPGAEQRGTMQSGGDEACSVHGSATKTDCHFGSLSCEQAFLDGTVFFPRRGFAVGMPSCVCTPQQLCRRGQRCSRQSTEVPVTPALAKNIATSRPGK